jgi:hypothetical protein
VNLYRAKTTIAKEAGALFMYDINIAVRAGETQTTKMRCQIPHDIEITDIVPHVHLHATGMRAYATPPGVPRWSVTASTSRQFLNSRGFGDLETVRFSEPFKLFAGEYLDYECDFNNNEVFDIYEGPKKYENEMCLFVAGYYPRLDPVAELCLLPGSGSVQAPPGGQGTCSEVLDCSIANGGRATFAGRECFLDVCERSQESLNNLQNCVYQFCQDCGSQDDCNFCTGFACGIQLTACRNSNC